MHCPQYGICKKWEGQGCHPAGKKFAIIEEARVCVSLDYSQCLYLYKIHNPALPLLLVEDEEKIRENIFHMLTETYGNRIAIYPSATYYQAYQLLRRKVFLMALFDIRLPDGSGVQLLEDVKRESNVTITIMITAFDKCTELMDHAKEKGADGFIGKPFSYDDIRAVLAPYITELTDNQSRTDSDQ